MQKKYNVQQGDNMPVQAPFYKSPNNPQYCDDLKQITIYCRTTPEIICKYLENTPFEYVTDQFIINFGDYSNGTAASFYDAAIVIPVRYKDMLGGYFLIEYEDLPSSVSGGRELWGYPKKVGDFSMKQENNKIEGVLSREGKEILSLELDLERKPEFPLPDISPYPHLLLWTMPRYAGPGIQCQKLLSRDTSMDFMAKETRETYAKVTLSGYENPPVLEPLDEWNPIQVYGARYTIGDYACTEENGWAKLVDIIIPDSDY